YLFCVIRPNSRGMFPHAGELSRVTGILLAWPVLDFCLNRGSAVTGIRMVTKKLRALISLRCEFLKKIGQRDRIDPGFPQNDCANCVGLCFIAAGILHHQCSRSNLDSCLSCSARSSSKLACSSSGEPCQSFQQRCFALLLRGMLHVYMRHFVSHHTS